MSYVYTDASENRVRELFDPVFGEDNYGVSGYAVKDDSNFKRMQKLLGLDFAPKCYLTTNLCERRDVSRMIQILREEGFNVALEQEGKISYPKR